MCNSKIVGSGLLFIMLFSPSAQAKLCKWVGPDGKVLYGEISSAKATASGGTALADKAGVEGSCTEAGTPEEVRLRQQEEAKKDQEKKRRANTLRSTYSNEQEIDLAFERNAALVNARLNVYDIQLKSARDALADLNRYVDERKQQGRAAPQSVYDDIAATKERIARLDSERAKVDDELKAMKARCEEDKVLYRKISTLPVVPENKPVLDHSYPHEDNPDICCIRSRRARKYQSYGQ